MAKRLIAILFIGLVGVFMMSHNASASNLSLSVSNPVNYDVGQVECAVFGQSITLSTNNTCVWGPNVGGVLQGNGLSWISTHQKFAVLAGYVYEVYVDVGTSNNAELMIPVIWSSFNDSGNFTLVDFEKVSNDNNLGSSATYEGYVSTYRFVLRPKGNYNIGIELGYSDRSANMLYLVGDNWPVVIDTRISAITRWKLIGEPSNSDIVNAINSLKQSQEAQNAKEEQATENIENQSPSDMQVGSDSSAQSLIGTLSSFLSYITNLQATNCNVSLPFPSYAGGTQTFNVCQGKDKAGNIVSIFSSLTLFVFYLPVAFKLLGIIYSEIRSFTNG